MDAGTIRLLEFLNRQKSVFRIPVYQRKYEWTDEQVNQYFYDIEKIALNEEYEGHFLGTIVFVRSNFPNMGTDYNIIDGQQRITTTFLLLKAIYDSLDSTDYRRDEISELYFTNKHVESEYERKLISVDGDRKDYEELLIHNQSDNPSKIHMNYNRLMYLIQHSNADVIQLYNALTKIKIVYIELEQGKKDENPQTIFESLNSTGLSLTESDLIRNYLLMNEMPSEQETLYKHYWLRLEKLLTNAKISDFIRDYLTMKTGAISNKSRVYQNFKTYISQQSITSEQILKDLNRFADHYHVFLNPDSGDQRVRVYLDAIEQLKSTVTYPYLLRLFDKYYNSQEMSPEDFEKILQYTTSYLVRRLIINLPTNSLNKVFAGIGKELQKQEDYKSELESFTNYIMSRTGSALFPRNEKVKEAIRTSDMYNRSNKLAKLILSSIEYASHKEKVGAEHLTIEHIMPNTLTPAWRNELGSSALADHMLYKDTLGNLTLTNYNSELSNKSFYEKKQYYKDSNIKITRDVASFEHWNKQSMLKRSEEIFNKVIEIWPIPFDHFENKLDNINTDAYYPVYELLNVTGKKPKNFLIKDVDYSANTWKGIFISYLDWLANDDLERFLELPKQKKFQKILSYSSSALRRSESLHGIFVETNLDAQSIYNYLGMLAEHFDMEEDVLIQISS